MLVTGQKVLQKLRNNSELCLRFSSDFWRLPNLQNIEKIALKTKVTANDVLILGIRYIQKLNLDCHCPQIWIHSGLSKNIIMSFFLQNLSYTVYWTLLLLSSYWPKLLQVMLQDYFFACGRARFYLQAFALGRYFLQVFGRYFLQNIV